MTRTDPDRDRRLLLLSVWASAGFAVVSSVWGVLSGSSMIVFDGLYSFASVGLSARGVFALQHYGDRLVPLLGSSCLLFGVLALNASIIRGSTYPTARLLR